MTPLITAAAKGRKPWPKSLSHFRFCLDKSSAIQTLEELAGDRRDEYEAALAEAGVTRHAVWHQETTDGTLAIVYMVADDESGVGRFGASDAPLNRWFREQMKHVHGIDISEAGPPPTKVHDITLAPRI